MGAGTDLGMHWACLNTIIMRRGMGGGGEEHDMN